MDLTKEKREATDIIAKLANGVKAVLSGIDFPQLEGEMAALRIRKSELEDIIARNAKNAHKLDKSKLVDFFILSAASMDGNVKQAIKEHVTKIYTHINGSLSVNVGVHVAYSGSPRTPLLTIIYFINTKEYMKVS